MDRSYDVITFISKYCCFKKAWGSQFRWHHQNYDHVYKKNYKKLKDSIKVKTIRNYGSKCNLYLYFFKWQSLLISPEIGRCVTWFIYFLDFLWVKRNCAKSHHCRISVTDFNFHCPTPILEQPQKCLSRIGLKAKKLLDSFTKNEDKNKDIVIKINW